ncbi:sensor histidine kinase [uncultured Polaribacter sp.]|uniref:sensor histidine kinase n=1 Tax=uncultured Polaribacter sp. TaxID=174711 RepID=UPI0026265E56|nr:sensor histidine kinase [uncultured Polaribacter sp.]
MFFIGITVVLIASIVLEIQSLGNVLDPYYFIVLIVFLVDVLISHLNHTIQLKNEQTKAELILLRSQLNPHFFFNTLNNLYALTIKNSKQAPEVILKLSDMMRYTIYEGEKNSVSLKEEIMYLENYIELHKIRYKKDVKIEFNNTVHQNLTVAPLLFINLLENAFKHGIDMVLKNPFIKIDLNNDANFIYFSIENSFDKTLETTSTGIGLINLKRRLSLLYPNKHELKFTQKNNRYKATLKISI